MKSKEIKKKAEKKLNSPQDNLALLPITKRDHWMYKIYYKNVVIGIFQLSFGSREIGDVLIGKMSKQLGITSQQFKNMVNCTFWGRDFVISSRLIN